MGVPKFYRWISERYPNISRVIADTQIPDFDNFYLDMNGIIHSCSHVNEDNCETNVTEEEIFRNIFHYLDFLFRMIKPKKVFFMAIDGVAPRAKMNQQRARRFRAGQDRAKKLKAVAAKSGQDFEETAANHFDTNAITPGTQFMANLHEQLKYFIHVKLTTDPLWEGVDVHLSGHLTPGEGEHKIMDYIRYTRLQPGYDVNTRHCLYGLDADLIMLGLVTHETHFALLREEVKYGSKKVSKILTPEEISWDLFHTCLLRDYIDLEFHSLKDKLPFPYDLESIIDDWILMAYLVGNDFIPHLPHIHIKEEALTLLWNTYRYILPTLDGYMNESGELNLARFEIYLTELAKFDHRRYADENDSFKHLEQLDGPDRKSSKKGSKARKKKAEDQTFDFAVLDKLSMSTPPPPISTDQPMEISHWSDDPNSVGAVEDHDDRSSSSDTLSEKSDVGEMNNNSTAASKFTMDDEMDQMPLIEAEFRQHKNNYYRDKMKIDVMSSDQLATYVEEYIEALQWILKYYYQGCPSWSWFYPHHYAPYLSDLKSFKHVKLTFDKGTPFKPFEQLLSVLPPTSRALLPSVLRPLMTESTSPLLHFYPEHFELDQNEKKQSWEAIVLLPFIDEKLLLDSIAKYYPSLRPDEAMRNQHLPSLCFKTSPSLHPIGDALTQNSVFPPLKETRASCLEIPFDKYSGDGLYFQYGHFQDKDTIIFPRFPTLNVLPYTFGFKNGAVNLFESYSKAATLVLHLTYQPDPDCILYNPEWKPRGENSSPPCQITNGQSLIERYLGKCVFVDWPHFQYGVVCGLSDFRHLYLWSTESVPLQVDYQTFNSEEIQDSRNYSQTPIDVASSPFELLHENTGLVKWRSLPMNDTQIGMEYRKAMEINRKYELRQGVSIGPIPALLYVCPLIGYRTSCSAKSDQCTTSMYFSNQALAYPLQTTLMTLPNYKSDLSHSPRTVDDLFHVNDPIFALKTPYYSSMGYVQEISRGADGNSAIACRLESSELVDQPDIHRLQNKLAQSQVSYWTAQEIATHMGVPACVVAKITGNIYVINGRKRRERTHPTNVGLSWKANKPLRQLQGYTKKIDQVWLYSDAAQRIIAEYMTRFPEIFNEVIQRPSQDDYFELNIWPKNEGKGKLQQIRAWMKSLPTHSMALTDGEWQVLDAPVVNEIDRYVKAFYTKGAKKTATGKTKLVTFTPPYLFKADESLGMCDPDMATSFDLYDRVIIVRLGTGIPIGTRGTVVGILTGRNNLDTYFEILLDHLPEHSLEAILHRKKQQPCRIKVRSYHLLNYSHSLRMRSMPCFQQQISVPSVNTFAREYTQEKVSTRTSPTAKPKSAPPSASRLNPTFHQIQQQSQAANVNHAKNSAPLSALATPFVAISATTSASTEHAMPIQSLDSRHPGLSPGFLTGPPLTSTGSALSQDQLSSETPHVRPATSTHPSELNPAQESSRVQSSISLAKTNQPSL